MRVDLHIHSIYSDGGVGIEEIVKEAELLDIGFISVTDHNYFDVYSDYGSSKITLVPGVEISANFNGEEVHILAYGINITIQPFLEMIRNGIISEHIRIVRELSKKYKQISVEEFNEYVFDPKEGGWKLLRYLYSKGVVTVPTDYDKIVGTIISNDHLPQVETVVRNVHKVGGLNFLAHPFSYKFSIYESLNHFIHSGLDGIECYHPSLSISESIKLVELAKTYKMKITGGSDFHKGFGGRAIGKPAININKEKMEWLYELYSGK